VAGGGAVTLWVSLVDGELAYYDRFFDSIGEIELIGAGAGRGWAHPAEFDLVLVEGLGAEVAGAEIRGEDIGYAGGRSEGGEGVEDVFGSDGVFEGGVGCGDVVIIGVEEDGAAEDVLVALGAFFFAGIDAVAEMVGIVGAEAYVFPCEEGTGAEVIGADVAMSGRGGVGGPIGAERWGFEGGGLAIAVAFGDDRVGVMAVATEGGVAVEVLVF
jgi:hypothetical protein